MGIFGFILLIIYNVLWARAADFLRSIPGSIYIAIILGLSIAAVVCGGIDLQRIKKRLSIKKGRIFDILAIALGAVAFLVSAILMSGEIISLF